MLGNVTSCALECVIKNPLHLLSAAMGTYALINLLHYRTGVSSLRYAIETERSQAVEALRDFGASFVGDNALEEKWSRSIQHITNVLGERPLHAIGNLERQVFTGIIAGFLAPVIDKAYCIYSCFQVADNTDQVSMGAQSLQSEDSEFS